MKLIYTNENRFIVSNIKNIIENTGIETSLKNEYIAGAAGDLSPFDTWLELWVEDNDYIKAMTILESIENNDTSHDWSCSHCHEKNNASFELCWNCQHEKPL